MRCYCPDCIRKMLPDSLFPDSKDWKSGGIIERIEYLTARIEEQRKELDNWYKMMGNIAKSMMKGNKMRSGYQEKTLWDGVQRIYKFDNGYGASVVRHEFSYGGPRGAWEVAVLDANGELTYDTPVTNDVIGWLDEDGVEDILEQIENLPAV
jgi:hypothetical protein